MKYRASQQVSVCPAERHHSPIICTAPTYSSLEIAAYLLVNNNRDIYPIKKGERRHAIRVERERGGEKKKKKAKRDQRDFQGQFHSVERANGERPPAGTQQPG